MEMNNLSIWERIGSKVFRHQSRGTGRTFGELVREIAQQPLLRLL